MAQPNLAEHIDVFLQSIAGQRRSNQSPTDTTSSAAFQEDVEPSREERGSPPNSHLSPETQDTFHHLAICTRNAPKDDQRDSKHTLKSRNKRKCQRKKQQISEWDQYLTEFRAGAGRCRSSAARGANMSDQPEKTQDQMLLRPFERQERPTSAANTSVHTD